ncbi:MAG: hypothetical protein LBH19_14520 [Dysgonamonadaceae bacterium]|jgi:hypothetical protein|nr:hypothetical protein [Dysgonamonadaceae bacterium]
MLQSSHEKANENRTKKINFAGILRKMELIKEAKAKYNAYNPEEWTKIYFDKFSGGYNVCHKGHNFSKKGGGGDAERTVGKMLAKNNGKQVEFLPESCYQKSPDINFDGKTWDIKLIDNANEETIRNYIKDARKADNAIFYWNTNADKLNELISAIGRSAGYFKSKRQLNSMPDIYYMDNGILKLLWSK